MIYATRSVRLLKYKVYSIKHSSNTCKIQTNVCSPSPKDLPAWDRARGQDRLGRARESFRRETQPALPVLTVPWGCGPQNTRAPGRAPGRGAHCDRDRPRQAGQHGSTAEARNKPMSRLGGALTPETPRPGADTVSVTRPGWVTAEMPRQPGPLTPGLPRSPTSRQPSK